MEESNHDRFEVNLESEGERGYLEGEGERAYLEGEDAI